MIDKRSLKLNMEYKGVWINFGIKDDMQWKIDDQPPTGLMKKLEITIIVTPKEKDPAFVCHFCQENNSSNQENACKI